MEPYRRVPSVGDDPTYYERPVLKKSVWIWAVPAYFYAGGVGGAASVLAGALELLGGRRKDATVRRLRWLGLGGTGAGSALLIYDLGRPERFLYMLRVLRVTSPMSVGSWVLAANGAALSASLAGDLLGGRWARPARLAGSLSAVLSAIQCSYPAALLSCTAVPVWQGIRLSLPVVFTGSAMSSLGSLADLVGTEEPLLDTYAKIGKVLQLGAQLAAGREASRGAERVARPLRQGFSGRLWKASAALTAASLVLSLLPGKSTWKRRAAGLCGSLGAVGLRFAAMKAGDASVEDPRATFHSQRRQGVSLPATQWSGTSLQRENDIRDHRVGRRSDR